MCFFYLLFCLRLNIWIDRERYLIGLGNWRRHRPLLGKAVVPDDSPYTTGGRMMVHGIGIARTRTSAASFERP